MDIKPIPRSALLLFLFAAVGTGFVAFTFDMTKERIAYNEQAAILRNLHAIIAPELHDNDLLKDTITVYDRGLLAKNSGVTVYRARMQGTPVGAVLTPVSPDGYNGSIKLLVGITMDGMISGVRIISHRETPGLGDDIDQDRSDWIFGFKGLSLVNPTQVAWKVRRDGGQFDQFTGATISPRAVVKAVRNCLVYFETHKDQIFSTGGSGT